MYFCHVFIWNTIALKCYLVTSLLHQQLEQRLNDVEHFYSNTSKKQSNTPRGSSILKDKEKQISSFRRRQQDASRREAAGARRMQELVRQFGTILRQVTYCVPSVLTPFFLPNASMLLKQ